MTSVTERLRLAQQYPNGGARLPSADTCHEAADEIDRLTATQAELVETLYQTKIAMKVSASNARSAARSDQWWVGEFERISAYIEKIDATLAKVGERP